MSDVLGVPETVTRGMHAGNLPSGWLLGRQLHGLLGAQVESRGNSIPIGERAIGCDTSKWDGLIDFATMFGSGAKFVYFKATQGTTILDEQYNNSRTNCTQLPFGGYHFLTTADGSTQANWFCDHMSSQPGVLPPVVDVELASVASSLIRAFIAQVYLRLNVWCMVYTSAYFWSLVTGSDKTWISDHCPLWVAHYGTDYPLLPTGWTDYVIHQYSADGNGLGPTYGGQAAGMDLNRARQSWVDAHWVPAPTLEQRVAAIEVKLAAHGW